MSSGKWERGSRKPLEKQQGLWVPGRREGPTDGACIRRVSPVHRSHLRSQSGVESIGSDGRKGVCWAVVLSMRPSALANLEDAA